MNFVQKVVSGKCPQCEKEKIFSAPGNVLLFRAPKMNEKCSVCGHKYETEPGFFFGAMFVSYALVSAEMGFTYLFLEPLVSTGMLIFIMLVLIFLTSFFNYRFSRLIWIYMLTPKKTSTDS